MAEKRFSYLIYSISTEGIEDDCWFNNAYLKQVTIFPDIVAPQSFKITNNW